MKIGIPREIQAGERRAAGTPGTVGRLIEMGFEVLVEAGAGLASRYEDSAYEEAGATLVADAQSLWAEADIITKVNPPTDEEVALLGEGKLLISILQPAVNTELVAKIQASGGDALALDCIPRITRAQKMDVLSSQANIAGYRAVIEASNAFGGFFGGQITAAGKTPPAQLLVIGAGVAGLAAIGAARGLGAQVRAFDTRQSVKEQIQSMGASFLEVELDEDGETAAGYSKTMSPEFIEAEMKLFREQAAEVDIVITTALIPGRKAPLLWTERMLEIMKPGSVVVDLAASAGGNCAVTKADEIVTFSDVQVIGFTDLTSRLATHASQFFGSNICHLLDDMGKGTDFRVDLEDEVVRGALVVHQGEVIWPPPEVKKPPPPPPAEEETEVLTDDEAADVPTPAAKKEEPPGEGGVWRPVLGLALAAIFFGLAISSPPEAGHPSAFLQHFTVFVLACFVGWQVVWNVKAALHTPLMSVTNAISGIIIVGGILQVAAGPTEGADSSQTAALVLGALAIFFASINVAGGFLVTQRMLKMFRR